MFQALSMRSEDNNRATKRVSRRGVEITSRACLRAIASRLKPEDAHYFFSRTALNVPCLEGASPASGEKSTSPVIESGPSNFPLSVKVPASRPTLPTRNSTGPEKVIELPSPEVHFPSEGVAPPHILDRGSVTVRVPFPSPCASKRRERCWSLAKVTSIFQLPVTVGESALAKTKAKVFTAITRIIARAVFMFFSTSNFICAQIHWFSTPQSTAESHELFCEFASHPLSHHVASASRRSIASDANATSRSFQFSCYSTLLTDH